MANIVDLMQQIAAEKDISIEAVKRSVEDSLMLAYRKKYGTDENAEVVFEDETGELKLFSKKVVVEEPEDPVLQTTVEQAHHAGFVKAVLGDVLSFPIDTKSFLRIEIESAKQKTRSDLREAQKNSLYDEFSAKLGKLVVGYCQRKKDDDIYVSVGRSEALLPKRFQSPREVYQVGDRIRALVCEVRNVGHNVQIILSRSHPELVVRLLEVEIPEVAEGLVSVKKIVRDPGYRTKIAVESNRDDIDPAGVCIGQKGIRAQAIIQELEGEKVDIFTYQRNIRDFIRLALSPGKVEQIYLLDEEKRRALVIVPESQLSLAIGKGGQNVKLANRLVDWTLDVKTYEQAQELGIVLEEMPSWDVSTPLFKEEDSWSEGYTALEELNLDSRILDVLHKAGIGSVEQLVQKTNEELFALEGLQQDDFNEIRRVLAESVELVEEEALEEETLLCPECGAVLDTSLENCPSCGVGLSFEFE